MRICTIYRSAVHDQMYLYVDRKEGLERVPGELLERFGAAEEFMTLVLTADRYLSRAEAAKVLEQIDIRGFYIQMPPVGPDLPELTNGSAAGPANGPTGTAR